MWIILVVYVKLFHFSRCVVMRCVLPNFDGTECPIYGRFRTLELYSEESQTFLRVNPHFGLSKLPTRIVQTLAENSPLLR